MKKVYTSPLTLFKNFGLSPDTSNVALLKKKALAELDLLGRSTIMINNKEYTKNDILTYADSLQNEGHMDYHKAILEDIYFLNFLEANILKYDGQLLDKPLYREPNFIEWISPYVLVAQTHFAEEFLNNNDVKGWNKLSSLCRLMTAMDQNEYLNSLEHIIGKRRDKIFHYSEAGFRSMEELMILCDNRFVQMIVSLPETRFAELRDDLALLIMNISIKVFNQKDQAKGKGLMFVAKECSYSLQLKNNIDEKIHKMNGITSNEKNSSSSDAKSAWRIILFVVSLIIMLIRIARCSSHM